MDITIPQQTGYYADLTRGAGWTASGPGGLINNYLFTPNSPQEGFCVYLHNLNPTSPHAVNIEVSITGDQRVTSYQNNPAPWVQVYNSSTIGPIPAASTEAAYVPTFGAAGIEITFSGTSSQPGSPDTVDAYIVQNTTGCGQAGHTQVTVVGPNGQTTAANSLSVVLASNQPTVPVSIQGTPAVTVSGSVSITATSCGLLSNISIATGAVTGGAGNSTNLVGGIVGHSFTICGYAISTQVVSGGLQVAVLAGQIQIGIPNGGAITIAQNSDVGFLTLSNNTPITFAINGTGTTGAYYATVFYVEN